MAIERYDLAGTPILSAQLVTGDTVTVAIYEKDGTLVALDSNSATENIAGSGKYDYELDFTNKPESGFNYYDIKFLGALQTVWKSFSWDECVGDFGGIVCIDTNGGGTAGTAYPIGTVTMPVSNLADAKTIAARINTKSFCLKGSLTLDLSIAGFSFQGRSNKNDCEIDFNGQNIAEANFTNLTLTGTANGLFYCDNCYLEDITDIQCYAFDTQLKGAFTVAAGQGFYLWRGTTRDYGTITVDLNGTGLCALAECAAQVVFSNMTSPFSAIIHTGKVLDTIGNTVTAGFMYFGGIGEVIDNSTGTIKIEYVLPGSVYKTAKASYNDANSFGELLNNIEKISKGRWKIDNTSNTLILYDSDNVTPLFTFDLKDVSGNPTSGPNIFERYPT